MDKPSVRGVVERGIPVLTMNYDAERMFQEEASKELSSQLVDAYESLLEEKELQTKSCIVLVEAETAGSRLVRALFELFKRVVSEGRQLICVDYPADYIYSLTSLGLPALEGFSLASTKEEAISRLLSEEKE